MAGKQPKPDWMVDPPAARHAAEDALLRDDLMRNSGSSAPEEPSQSDHAPSESDSASFHQAFLSEPSAEEQALKELRSILMGKERSAINRLEGAVTGFISSVIRDDHLDQLVTRIIHDAVDQHMMTIRDDMRTKSQQIVNEAIEREVNTRRGTLQDQINPFVEDAVAERMTVARRNINAALDRTYEDVIERLSEVGRKKVVNELAPLLVRESKDRIRENRDQIQVAIDEIVEDMVWDGMHASVVRHMEKVMEEEQICLKTNQKPMWIAVGVAVVMTLVALLLWVGQGSIQTQMVQSEKRLQEQENRVAKMEQDLAKAVEAAKQATQPRTRPVLPELGP